MVMTKAHGQLQNTESEHYMRGWEESKERENFCNMLQTSPQTSLDSLTESPPLLLDPADSPKQQLIQESEHQNS